MMLCVSTITLTQLVPESQLPWVHGPRGHIQSASDALSND